VTIGDTNTVSSLTVEAHDASHASTEAIAVGAGIGIGVAGAVALSHVNPTTSATLSGSAHITTTGAVNVTADATPQVDSDAIGVGVAGAAGLGVSYAESQANGNVTASVGDGANFSVGSLSVSASRLTPTDSEAHTTDATAIAGGGGILFGASGAIATASSTATVTASLGNNVTLPGGDVSVIAAGGSSQHADATGVAIGFLGIGAAVATATSDLTTKATVGTGLRSNASRTGAFLLESEGVNTTLGLGTAGSGGVVSGNAAVGNANDTSSASTSIGATAYALYAGDVTILSANFAGYYAHADSTNAGVVGASGAFATGTIDTSATTTIPDGFSIISENNGVNGNVVEISSENDVTEESGGDNVDAAGGGGISVTAAESKSTITGHSTVTIGKNLTIMVKNDPESPNGSIGIDAGSQLNASDLIDLETGGAIAGAGVDSEMTANLYTSVNISTGATLTSSQDVGIGVYSIVDAALEADESTWGLAAVGVTDAHLTVSPSESISVGSGAQISALGDVNIRAGDSSSDHEQDSLIANANAEGYVRGLIAVPDASASAHLNTSQTVTISGATIISGRNTTIGADAYQPSSSADGTGHGYELGFIPVTDGSSDPQTNTTSSVNVNGSVEAGYYATLAITIDNLGNATGGFTDASCGNATCGYHQNTQSVPVTVTYDATFDPSAFLGSGSLDSQDQAILTQLIQAGTVGAIELSNLWAAGGNVIIDAESGSGSATFIAHGAPSITVTNNSKDFLDLAGTTDIPFANGGRIVFQGGVSQFGSLDPINTDQPGTVTILNNYPGDYQGNGSAPNSPSTGPGIGIGGEMSNLGGHIEIDNAQGSILAIAAIYADSVSLSAPNGALIENLGSNAVVLGSAPQSEFDSLIVYPAGNPHTGDSSINELNQSANTAIAYVATAENQNAVTEAQLLASEGIGNADFDFTALLAGAPTSSSIGPASLIYLGDCIPAWSGTCDSSGNAAISPDGSSYQYVSSSTNGSNGRNATTYYPMVPIESLDITSNDYGSELTLNDPFDTGTATNGIVAGSAVIVNAGIIDMNTKITVGPPTNWSASIPTGLTVQAYVSGHLMQVTLAAYELDWQEGKITNPTVTVPVQVLNAGDSPIGATYDARTNQITMNSVQAGNGAGIVRLTGRIVNTNNEGQIVVNGGLGQVEIENDTAATLVTQDIYAGTNPNSASAGTSLINLVDTGTGIQTLYAYRPDTGTVTYQTHNLNATMAQMQALQDGTTIVSSTAGNTATYDPQPGLRVEWQLRAELTRTVTTDNNSGHGTDWAFKPSPDNSDNPWVYYNYADGQYESADFPSITYTVDPSDTSVFSEQISASTASSAGSTICYEGGWNNFTNNTVNSACANDPNYDANSGVAQESFNFPTDAFLTLTISVKADNPIPITFGGGNRGLIQIVSVGDVLLDGNLTNGSGDTIIQSSGKITQANGETIATGTLEMDAGGGVGTSTQPIQAAISNGGTLGGSSGSAGFWLTLDSGAAITSINAGSTGDVQLIAAGSLTRGAFKSGKNFNVSGQDITLTFINSQGVETTDTGGIGTLASPLVISAHATLLANGGVSGGVVDVHAPDTVALQQIGGDLVVNQIISDNGDVWLQANGSILDVRGQTPAQVIGDDAAAALWARMHLTDGGLEQQTITAYENVVDRNYFQYWNLVDPSVGQVVDGAYELNSDKVGLFFLQAKAAACSAYMQAHPSATDCSSVPDPSDSDVEAYAASLYDSVSGSLADEIGALPGTEDDSFSYTVDPNSQTYTDLTKNAVWTDEELRVAIDRSALLNGPGPQPSVTRTVEAPHGSVTLIGNGVGKPAGSVAITMDDLTNGTLTDEQVGALTTATAKGSILINALVDGTPESFYLDSAPSDCSAPAHTLPCHTIQIESFSIAENAPLYVQVGNGEVLSVDAGTGGAYVQVVGGDIQLAKFWAQGNGSLTGPGAITGTNEYSPTVKTGGDFTIWAQGGDIAGPSGSALVIRVGGILRGATANGQVLLRQDQGNLTFDGVTAGNAASVSVSNGNLVQHSVSTGIIAKTLTLYA
ncbi:MAG: beta strand repeat-containing protein, partial [Gaiellaceae bacterium]